MQSDMKTNQRTEHKEGKQELCRGSTDEDEDSFLNDLMTDHGNGMHEGGTKVGSTNDDNAPKAALKAIRKKLSHRKSGLARALTTQRSGDMGALVSMAVEEAEVELPNAVREFATDVFQAVANPETQELWVDGQLSEALRRLGHNTNVHALKDICTRFDLEFPDNSGLTPDGVASPNSQKMKEEANKDKQKSSDSVSRGRATSNTSDVLRWPSRAAAPKEKEEQHLLKTVDLNLFLGIVYSELIDQAQPSDLAKSFTLFDRDGNGVIDMDEFEAGLTALGDMNPLDLEGRKAFLDKIDVNGDDTLSSAELVDWLATDTFERFTQKVEACHYTSVQAVEKVPRHRSDSDAVGPPSKTNDDELEET